MSSINQQRTREIVKIMAVLFVVVFIAGGIFSANRFAAGSDVDTKEKTTASLEPAFGNFTSTVVEPPVKTPVAVEPPQEKKPIADPRAEISISVGGDNDGKVLFTKSANEKLPVASLVKLMNALVVLKYYNLNQQVAISKAAMDQEGVQGVLQEGQVLSVEDLLYIALIESSNRAAYALSEVVGNKDFIALMNQEAEQMGLSGTHFEDVTGLGSQSYSTAQDIATLSENLLLQYPLFGSIVGMKKYNVYLSDGSLHHTLDTTNEMLGQKGIIGGKTGYTIDAKGCFMAIEAKSSGTYVIHVVLGSDDRFLDMGNLIDFVNRKYLNLN